jgi:ribonuclease MRP protein subunit SNM1
MISSTTAAKLRYLNDSAHLLSYSAPSTAAFLQSRHDQVVTSEHAAVPDTRGREICGACGFNMLWSPLHLPVRLEPELRKCKRADGEASSKSNGTKTAVLSCQMCHAKTEYKLPAAGRDRRSSKFKRTHHSAELKTAPIPPGGTSTADTHTTPRKRAKGRKQNSLSAMLAKSKAEAASQKTGFGLDLMDLMRGT